MGKGERALKEIKALEYKLDKEKTDIKQAKYVGITFGCFVVALGMYYSIHLMQANQTAADLPLLKSIIDLLWLIIYGCIGGFIFGMYNLIREYKNI